MRSVRLLVGFLVACSHPATPPAKPEAATPAPRGPVTLSIIGTNDLHGALERLPLLAGFVANLRAARAADGGGVVLVDGGDMFQGTLESNLAEGADVVRAYNQIGYTAVAVGNHEFDYGPEGPRVVAASGEDPRGALKARMREAKYPFVTANIVEKATGKRPAWPNLAASTLIEVAGVKVGIIGATTEQTPHTTMPANFADLAIVLPAPAIAEQAGSLRARGAQVIVATMHIGSMCRSFDNPDDVSSCERGEELFKLVAGLPKGSVDVIVAGHTHAGMAHRLDGVAVIESYSGGRAFGRVDLQIGPDGRVAAVQIAKPHRLCESDKGDDRTPPAISACAPGDYEGKPVVADPAVQRIADEALARAGERRKEKLGITVAQTIQRSRVVESAEGNFFSDLMLAARPDAQVSVTNGGGLRADLPAGELTYGQLFEAIPFDNRFAIVELSGGDLRQLLTGNLQRGGGILSWGGLTAKARCSAGKLEVQVRVAGKPLDDKARYKLVTSDFLASGGDGMMIAKLKLPDGAIQMTDTIMRDAFSDVLRSWKGTPRATLDPAQLFSPTARRLDYEGKRPLECGAGATAPDKEAQP
jgi:2',3'-cyclic-nucleotide 2'-phosphodiesterase (5'-nucleotidase family)